MYLLLYISLGFAAIALSLMVLAILWPERKADEADYLLMQVRPPTELIGDERQVRSSALVHCHRYYRYKRSVYDRIRRQIMRYAFYSSLVGLLCAIAA